MKRKYLIGGAVVAMTAGAVPAQAQDFYMGQILTVGFSFCPRGTLEAAGQLLPISSNSALFSLLGTTYGGDGITNFQLPDYRGRYGIGQGQGPGQPTYQQGQTGGATTALLTINSMPSHSHDGRIRASNQAPNTNDPNDNGFATFAAGTNQYTTGPDNVPMRDDDVQISRTGADQPFSIQNPFLAMRYCVVTQGLYPPRN